MPATIVVKCDDCDTKMPLHDLVDARQHQGIVERLEMNVAWPERKGLLRMPGACPECGGMMRDVSVHGYFTYVGDDMEDDD